LKILRKTIRIDVSELLRDFVSASKAVKLRADIYHGYGGALYPLLKLKLPKKSFVATLHGTTYGLMKATFPTLHYRIAVLQKEKITQHFSDMIIAVSKQVMFEAIKFYHTPEEKIRIIYNGVDTPLFNSIKKEYAKNCLKIPLDIPVISFIGRCDHQKGADKLIQIIKYLMKHSLYDKWLIQIVGWGGKYFKEVQELAQRLQNRVILRSFIPYKEVILRVSASDIFIFPTRYEGHSIALLEAMAAGNAIITSKLPSIQETLNEREGILIEVDKPIEE
ncbi:MAG: glycosyltransferase family 4 protein, partial [Candidatus Micrarchaeia archaeon]